MCFFQTVKHRYLFSTNQIMTLRNLSYKYEISIYKKKSIFGVLENENK